MAWHKGSWLPVFVKEWYPPKCSQHLFDPYSFCVLVAGLILHLLLGTDDIDQWIYGFLLALGLELLWEVIGNTPLVLKRIRANNGTSGEYNGAYQECLLNSNFDCCTSKATPSKISLEMCSLAALDISLAPSLLPWSCGGSASSGFWCLRCERYLSIILLPH